MERILGDWFQKDLFYMNSERALNVLVKIFEKEEINQKDLATKLRGVFKKEDPAAHRQNWLRKIFPLLSGHDAKSNIFPQSSSPMHSMLA